MSLKTLQQDLQQCTTSLLAIARDHCWNKFSDEVVFIISEIEDDEGGWPKKFESRRKKDRLEPMAFDVMIGRLEERYPEIHDINLFIHRAEKHRTIIDIRYFPKAKVDYETKPETPSMLHAKIALPPYRGDGSQKFDVHWEFGGLRHRWKMFW